QLEETLFTDTIKQILEDCHKALVERAAKGQTAGLAANCKDVDLYLTVARNLLAGAGAPEKGTRLDVWKGDLLVPTRLGMDQEALARLKDIQSLRLQVPRQDEPTRIYGGERYMDYSQFKPRGHYLKSEELQRYFRCLMWLGRADCGWNVLPVDPRSELRADSD